MRIPSREGRNLVVSGRQLAFSRMNWWRRAEHGFAYYTPISLDGLGDTGRYCGWAQMLDNGPWGAHEPSSLQQLCYWRLQSILWGVGDDENTVREHPSQQLLHVLAVALREDGYCDKAKSLCRPMNLLSLKWIEGHVAQGASYGRQE